MTAPNSLGRSSPAILRVSGRNRFPSPPARISPQWWQRASLPLNFIACTSVCIPHSCFCTSLWQNRGFRAFNRFQGSPILRELRKTWSRLEFIAKNVKTASKTDNLKKCEGYFDMWACLLTAF